MTRRKHGTRLSTLSPEQLVERLSLAIEESYDWDSTPHERMSHEVPEGALDRAIEQWMYGVTKTFVQWPCDSDTCPSRPAWEQLLSDQVYADRVTQEQLKERMADVMRGWLMERLLAFAAAHPEARLAD